MVAWIDDAVVWQLFVPEGALLLFIVSEQATNSSAMIATNWRRPSKRCLCNHQRIHIPLVGLRVRFETHPRGVHE